MFRTTPFLLLLLLSTPLASPSTALTLDEILEKHVVARGGAENWQAIQTITLTGSFSGFSKVGPFTLHRARDQRYYLDHILNEQQVIFGYDGESAWWVNPMRSGEWAERVTGIDLSVLMQKVDFESPFFNPEAKGYEVEFLGEGEFEGQPALRLKLVRADGGEETWYLDPSTFLELGFEATGSDFGTPRPQRTYFDDFRKVEGVVLPFYTEAQWYTRLRILEVEDVTLNPNLDNSLFSMPIPEAMARLNSLTGQWDVAVSRELYTNGPWLDSERQATITSRLRGTLLEEQTHNESGAEVVSQITWDRFQERYRFTQIDDSMALLDVQEGNFDENGNLILSNQETGTAYAASGTTFSSRTKFFEVSADSFKMEVEYSMDGGESWAPGLRLTYSRAEP